MRAMKRLVALTAAIALGALTISCTGEGDTIVQTQGAPSGITVNGTGRVSGTPDIATVSIGVQVEGASVEEAREGAAQAQTAVVNAVKGNGVNDRDVQTSNFNISPRYDFRTGSNQITGYTVTNTLSVKVRNLDNLSKIVDDATAAGGTNAIVNGLSFGIDDPEELRSQAREAALNQAKARAEDIARVTGVSLGKPLSIVEETHSPYVESSPALRQMAMADTATPIESGSLDVVINVQVLYRIE